jgi:cysteine desulfurase / selenocysteine lyase
VTPADLRNLVPAARSQAYLDTATYGPASLPVVAAIAEFTELWSRGAARFEAWEEAAEDCRRLFARLLHCQPEDVAIQPFVSTAATALARQLRPGERVVVDDLEFSSNLWPWLHQRERGVRVTLVEAEDGRLPRAALERAIDAGPLALLAVSAVQSSNGFRADLPWLAERVHAAGGLLFVDACQAAGAVDLDPARDGFDLLATDSYKWLMGPRGAGYLYLAPAAQERFEPLALGWRVGRDVGSSYYGPRIELSPTASRYDSSLSWISVAGDRAALGLLAELGAAAVEAHDLALAGRFREGLSRLGLASDRFEPCERSAIFAVPFPDPAAALEALGTSGVVAARRAQGVRFSFHAFNDEDDVDRALGVLERYSALEL